MEQVFKREVDEYKTELDILKAYFDQITSYIQIVTDATKEESKKIVKEIIKKHKTNHPVIRYRYRKDNGDREVREDKLLDYIKEVTDNKEVLVPSFTAYDHPSKNKSFHAQFLDINIKKRSKDKHEAFRQYQLGNMSKYLYHNVLQKVRKIFNNSLSGAYASKSTILYNPSAHYTLTSITRSVASIGNAVSESIIAGNKHLKDYHVTINYVNSIVTYMDDKLVKETVDRFKLYKPSAKEVFETLKYSFINYWRNEEKESRIIHFLEKLNGYQLAAVAYVNDLYHLKKFNNDFVRDMLTKLATKKNDGSTDNLEDLNSGVEGVTNLAHHICMEDIQGEDINYKAMEGTGVLKTLASTAKNISDTLSYFKPIFRSFFTTDILPVNIAHIKEMQRDAIVLSDTDSTCGSYDNWVNWYFGHDRFTPEAVGLSAAVMTINTQVIDHNIKIFAKNMNIQDSLSDLLKMKNEFFWSVFVTANVSKHYYANTWIQEGNVYAGAKLELKGVHLIASSGNQEIVNKIHKLMSDFNERVEKGENISPVELLNTVGDLERSVLETMEKGGVNIYKMDKIKEPSAYKIKDKMKNPYYHHLLWDNVFAPKYGKSGDPTYMTLKIPTTIKGKKGMQAYLDSIEDKSLSKRLQDFLKKAGKDALGTFRVPMLIGGSSGIPKEAILAADKKRIVIDNLNALYVVLESLSIYRKPGLLFSEMGY